MPDEVAETFKDRIRQAEEFREILSLAFTQPTVRGKREALLKIQRDLGDLKVVPRSVLIELIASFRDVEAFDELIVLYNAFPDNLKDNVVAKQQFALALNRRNQPGDRDKALRRIDELLSKHESDPETLGIKGRIRIRVTKFDCRDQILAQFRFGVLDETRIFGNLSTLPYFDAAISCFA